MFWSIWKEKDENNLKTEIQDTVYQICHVLAAASTLTSTFHDSSSQLLKLFNADAARKNYLGNQRGLCGIRHSLRLFFPRARLKEV